MVETEPQPKRIRINPEEPLPKRHHNRQHQNQAKQVITETQLTKIRRNQAAWPVS